MCLVALQLGRTWTQLLVSDVEQLLAQNVFHCVRGLEVNALVPTHVF